MRTVLFSIESEIQPSKDVLESNILGKLYLFEIDEIEILEIRFKSIKLIVNLNRLHFVLDLNVWAL